MPIRDPFRFRSRPGRPVTIGRSPQATVPGGARHLAAITVLVALAVARPAASQQTLTIFDDVGIQWGGDPAWHQQSNAVIGDNGRWVERTIQFPQLDDSARVTSRVNVTDRGDPWDRAGNIQLLTDDGTIELHKFITAFSDSNGNVSRPGGTGSTSHELDVTELAPRLSGQEVTVRAWIDTWVPNAWSLDFSLSIDDTATDPATDWVDPVYFDPIWQAGEFPENRRSVTVNIPSQPQEHVELYYYATGHATDGSGGEEFTRRTHRIFIDGTMVFLAVPWRTDGADFYPGINASSSALFNRAGWMPGDDVSPYVIDATNYLTPGEHTIEYEISHIEGTDSNGHFGYWRTSSFLTGIAASPAFASDFDSDGDVDGDDFLVWQSGFGGFTGDASLEDGDADENGLVDGDDFLIWQAEFGSQADGGGHSPGAVTLPEPSAASLAAALMAVLFVRRT